MALGGGLGGHQDVDLARLHGQDQAARGLGVEHRVGGEDGDAGLGEQAARLLLNPLHAGTDRNQAVLGAAMGAGLGLLHGKAGQVADQAAGIAVLDQPGIGVRRGQLLAAGPAQHQGRVAAAIEEQQALLAPPIGVGDRFHQRRRQPASRLGRMFAQVDQVHVRQARRPVPVGQAQPAIAAGLGVPQALQRGRGRGQHHLRALDLGPGHGQVASLIDEAVLLLVRPIVLLVDHQQAQGLERQEQGRARAHHYAAAALDHAFPDLPAAVGGHGRVPLGRLGAEALGEPGQHRLGQGDLGQQHQHLGGGLLGQHPGHGLQIDLGLARAGDPVQQGDLEAAGAGHGRQGLQRGALAGIEPGAGTAGIGLAERLGRGGPMLGQAALVQQGLDHPGRDLGRGGQLAGAHRPDGGLQHPLARRRGAGGRGAGGGQLALGLGAGGAGAAQGDGQGLAWGVDGIARRPLHEGQRARRQGLGVHAP